MLLAGAGQALAGPVFKDEKAFEQIVILSTSGSSSFAELPFQHSRMRAESDDS